MNKKLYRVKARVVERIDVESRVFAESRAEAERLVRSGQGERVPRSRQRRIIEGPTFNAQLDKGVES